MVGACIFNVLAIVLAWWTGTTIDRGLYTVTMRDVSLTDCQGGDDKCKSALTISALGAVVAFASAAASLLAFIGSAGKQPRHLLIAAALIVLCLVLQIVSLSVASSIETGRYWSQGGHGFHCHIIALVLGVVAAGAAVFGLTRAQGRGRAAASGQSPEVIGSCV